MKRIQLENRSDLKAEIPLEAPYSLFIDPSTICNFKCKFCMNSKIEKPKVMDFTLYKKIIDDLQEFKTPIKVIRLYGFGEPLVNTNFCDMVKYAKKSDKVLSVDTTTNGSLIDKAYAEKLIMSGIDRINISIEGVNSDQYKRFTGCRVDFDKMVKNFEYLYKIRNKTTIFMKICGDYLIEAEKAEFYRVFEPISDGCDIEHTMSCWYDCQVENVNTSVGIYGQPLDDVSTCPYVFYSLLIQHSGAVSLCFLDWNKRLLIGDVRDNTIKKIWSGNELRTIQIAMLKNEKPAVCKTCQQLKAGMPVNLDPYKEELLKRLM
jgi:radical SAM protein with 4Fe4S-binding SPASM domain